MIARLWTARTTPALCNSYLEHFSKTVQPSLRKLKGFCGATVFTRPLEGSVEVIVTTYWESLEAIAAFAGPDRDAAVVAEEATRLLSDFDKRVRHYDVALANLPAPFCLG
jgi:heme-degrading monooxygenase HmoA